MRILYHIWWYYEHVAINLSSLRAKSLFNISYVSAGNIFNAVLGFLFLSSVAKALSVDDFGRYALLTSLLIALSRIIDFGTSSVYVAESISKQKELKNILVSLRIILFGVAFFVSIITLYFLGLLDFTTGAIFTIGLIGYGIAYTLYAFFQKSQKFEYTVFVNSIPALIKGTSGLLILTGIVNATLTLTFSIFAISMLFSSFLYFYLPSDLKKFKLAFSETYLFFKKSVYAGSAQLIKESWSAISNTVLKIFHSFTDVGIFSLSERIAKIFTLVSLSIFTVLLPKNAQRKKENQSYNYKETAFIALIIIILAAFAIFFGKLFISLFFGDKFADSLLILDILIIAYALQAIHTFMENYFFVEEKTKIILGVTVLHLGIFLSLAALLIPQYAVVGLAYTQLISAGIALLITIGVMYKNKSS